jgi:hypothetical protein
VSFISDIPVVPTEQKGGGEEAGQLVAWRRGSPATTKMNSKLTVNSKLTGPFIVNRSVFRNIHSKKRYLVVLHTANIFANKSFKCKITVKT